MVAAYIAKSDHIPLLWQLRAHKEAEMNPKVKSAIESYARSFLVAAITAYTLGATDIKDIATAGLIAVIAPAIRAINPNDPAFGKVADVVEKELAKKPISKKKTK
jgi:hypothetical protein